MRHPVFPMEEDGSRLTVFIDSAVEVHLPFIFPLPTLSSFDLVLRRASVALLYTPQAE